MGNLHYLGGFFYLLYDDRITQQDHAHSLGPIPSLPSIHHPQDLTETFKKPALSDSIQAYVIWIIGTFM